jgi:hypothetical protein
MSAASGLASPASLVAQAQKTCTRAMSLDWPEDRDKVIGEAVTNLVRAVGRYYDLCNNVVPASAGALRTAAENAAGKAAEVIRLLPGAEGEK